MSARKKLLFACITTVAFFVLLEGILYLFNVQPQIIEHDPYVGFTSHVALFVDKPGTIGVVKTAQNKLPWFNEQEFSRHKSTDSFRIFCLGGSTTYGRPYDDLTSFCGWLRELLPAADPSRDWEVINAGGISYASYRIAFVLEELIDYQPDLIIVYAGHNEFLESRTYGPLKESSPFIKSLHSLVNRTRIANALGNMLHRDDDSTTPKSAANMLPGEVATRLDKGVGPRRIHPRRCATGSHSGTL